MPMPPPQPITEPAPMRRRRREVEQLQRALHDQGPADTETLKRLVGGSYWEQGRFDKALSWGVQKHLLARDEDGRYRPQDRQ